MKVLYIHHGFGPGGAPRSLQVQLRELMKIGIEPFVVLPDRDSNASVIAEFKRLGCSVRPVRSIRPFNGSTVAPCSTWKEKAYSIAAWRSTRQTVAQIVRDIQPELVHLNSTCLVAAADGARSVSRSIPVVAHVREPLLPNVWGRLLARLNRRYVDHFISIDKFGLTTVGCPEHAGTVIQNTARRFSDDVTVEGVDEARRRLNLDRSRVVLSLIARICEANGGLEFVRAIHKLDRQIPENVRFVVAGFDGRGGDYEQALLTAIEDSKRFHSMPFLSSPEELIRASDAIVAPFLTPHGSRTVIEAASMSRPAIVSSVPNLKEMVLPGSSGFVFDWTAPSSIVAAIQSVSDASQAELLRSSAFRFAKQHFDAVRNAGRIKQVYHAVLERHPNGVVDREAA